MSIKLNSAKTVPSASFNLTLIIAIGLFVGIVAGFLASWRLAPLVAWDSAGLIYIITTWARVLKFNAGLVERHALREDPSRVTADLILLVASVASLAAVVLVLSGSNDSSAISRAASAGLSVLSVVVSWLLVHTVFALKYAELYYTAPAGGVDFGDTKAPVYVDFAYLAFTLGMTYQVSDSTLKSRNFRTTALKHALLSYLFGTIIIATTINLVAGLGQ